MENCLPCSRTGPPKTSKSNGSSTSGNFGFTPSRRHANSTVGARNLRFNCIVKKIRRIKDDAEADKQTSVFKATTRKKTALRSKNRYSPEHWISNLKVCDNSRRCVKRSGGGSLEDCMYQDKQ